MSEPINEPKPGEDSAEAARAEREALIAELEKDLARPARVGVLPPVAAIALLGACFLMWWMRADVAYFFSPRDPIELGAEGNYQLANAVTNRYAQLHGVPSARGWYVDEKDGSFVIVGVNDTPVLVRRVTFPDEQVRNGKRPQPRQNPFFVRGRLLSRADASRYAEVFTEFESWSGTKASWLLLAEESPGRDLGNVGGFTFLALFAAVNLWMLVRGLSLLKRR